MAELEELLRVQKDKFAQVMASAKTKMQEAVVRNDSALAEAQAASLHVRNERDALAVEVESARHSIKGLQQQLADALDGQRALEQELADKRAAVEALELHAAAAAPEHLESQVAALRCQLEQSHGAAAAGQHELEAKLQRERDDADKQRAKLASEAKAQHRIAEAATLAREAAVREREALGRELAAVKKDLKATKSKVSDKDKARIKALEDQVDRGNKERAALDSRLQAAADRERKDKEALGKLKARCDALASSCQAAGAAPAPPTPGTPAAPDAPARPLSSSFGFRKSSNFINPKSVLAASGGSGGGGGGGGEAEIARLRVEVEEREHEAERLRSVLLFRQEADAKGESRDAAVEEYVESMRRQAEDRAGQLQGRIAALEEQLAARQRDIEDRDASLAAAVAAADQHKHQAAAAAAERDRQRERAQALEQSMDAAQREVLAASIKVRDGEAALADARKAHAAETARAQHDLEAWRREAAVLRSRLAELEDASSLEHPPAPAPSGGGGGGGGGGRTGARLRGDSAGASTSSPKRAGAAGEGGGAVEADAGWPLVLAPHDAHTDTINCAAVVPAPVGCLLVTASSDGSAQIFSMHSRQRVASLSLGGGKGVACAAAPTSAPNVYKLVVCSSDGHLHTWSLSHQAPDRPPDVTALGRLKVGQGGGGGRGELKAVSLLHLGIRPPCLPRQVMRPLTVDHLH